MFIKCYKLFKLRWESILIILIKIITLIKIIIKKIAIFDGTNTTKKRRQMIISRVKKEIKDIKVCIYYYQILWIECICNDNELIMKNIIESKINGPDYKNMDKNEAL